MDGDLNKDEVDICIGRAAAIRQGLEGLSAYARHSGAGIFPDLRDCYAALDRAASKDLVLYARVAEALDIFRYLETYAQLRMDGALFQEAVQGALCALPMTIMHGIDPDMEIYQKEVRDCRILLKWYGRVAGAEMMEKVITNEADFAMRILQIFLRDHSMMTDLKESMIEAVRDDLRMVHHGDYSIEDITPVPSRCPEVDFLESAEAFMAERQEMACRLLARQMAMFAADFGAGGQWALETASTAVEYYTNLCGVLRADIRQSIDNGQYIYLYIAAIRRAAGAEGIDSWLDTPQERNINPNLVVWEYLYSRLESDLTESPETMGEESLAFQMQVPQLEGCFKVALNILMQNMADAFPADPKVVETAYPAVRTAKIDYSHPAP